ncbi:MAG: lytic transglycosylase domain-containing protein [Elusimicrobiota bacterium]
MKKIFTFLFLIFYILYSTPYRLNAREGIIVLKNGGTIKGNVIANKNGNYIVETKKWSATFLKKEIKSVKYTQKTKSNIVNSKFIQKMKNTKKNLRYEKEKNCDYDSLICFYANKYNLDPAFVKAVIKAESNFDPKNISNKGAIGLMQLMPRTANGLKINPNNIEENIEGGIRYLSYMCQQFGDIKLALAGYNAGPNAVKKYGRKIPPYEETQNYVQNVLKNYQKYKSDKQLDKQIWYFTDGRGCIYISNIPRNERYNKKMVD